MDEFWRGQKVLVTGAGGFIGSHLVEKLASNGASVTAFVRYNSRNDPGLLRFLQPDLLDQIKMIGGNLCDQSALREVVDGVQFIFHLGALISIPYSYVHPQEVVETNILGTTNILLAGRGAGVRRIIHTSSSEVYGSALRAPIDETHPLQGQSPYSASKIGADKIVESFHLAYDLPVVTVRPFNTYGPRQSTRAVIPTIITQALTSSSITLGNLDSSRDFTYVADTVEGFLRAARTPDVEGQVINLGFGKDISIRKLVDEIRSILGKPLEIQLDPQRLRPEKSEVNRLISDNRRAKDILDWSPQVNLREGLSRTIEWVADHLDYYQTKQYHI
jgi:dTDP-glucose 4,6-dehydratase